MVNGELHATDRQPDTQVSVFSLANFRIFRVHSISCTHVTSIQVAAHCAEGLHFSAFSLCNAINFVVHITIFIPSLISLTFMAC